MHYLPSFFKHNFIFSPDFPLMTRMRLPTRRKTRNQMAWHHRWRTNSRCSRRSCESSCDSPRNTRCCSPLVHPPPWSSVMKSYGHFWWGGRPFWRCHPLDLWDAWQHCTRRWYRKCGTEASYWLKLSSTSKNSKLVNIIIY